MKVHDEEILASILMFPHDDLSSESRAAALCRCIHSNRRHSSAFKFRSHSTGMGDQTLPADADRTQFP